MNQRPLALHDGRNPIDIHVGSRIKARRLEIGMSQERLATKLNVAPQQVQKYESAVNRVSASKLFEIADHLQTTVSAFFEGLPSKYAQLTPRLSDDAKAAMSDQDFLHLIEALARMEKGPVRSHLFDLVRAMVVVSEPIPLKRP